MLSHFDLEVTLNHWPAQRVALETLILKHARSQSAEVLQWAIVSAEPKQQIVQIEGTWVKSEKAASSF